MLWSEISNLLWWLATALLVTYIVPAVAAGPLDTSFVGEQVVYAASEYTDETISYANLAFVVFLLLLIATIFLLVKSARSNEGLFGWRASAWPTPGYYRTGSIRLSERGRRTDSHHGRYHISETELDTLRSQVASLHALSSTCSLSPSAEAWSPIDSITPIPSPLTSPNPFASTFQNSPLEILLSNIEIANRAPPPSPSGPEFEIYRELILAEKRAYVASVPKSVEEFELEREKAGNEWIDGIFLRMKDENPETCGMMQTVERKKEMKTAGCEIQE